MCISERVEGEKENRKSTLTMLTLGAGRRVGLEWFVFLSPSFFVFFKTITKKPLIITCLYKKQTGSLPLQTRSNLISLVWHTTYSSFPASLSLPFAPGTGIYTLFYSYSSMSKKAFPSQELLLPGSEQGSLPFIN